MSDVEKHIYPRKERKMTEYIIAFFTAFTSIAGAYLASTLAMRNTKQEQFFTEKKNIYYELTTILPDVDKFLAQSDYMDGTEGSGRAEDKISIMEIQLEDIVNRKQELIGQAGVTKECMYNLDTKINNLKYKINIHKEYLVQMKELKDKIVKFELNGNRNLLRIFASTNVWNSYVRLNVALDNEYLCNIGVKKADITYHINDLITYMRMDLSGRSK